MKQVKGSATAVMAAAVMMGLGCANQEGQKWTTKEESKVPERSPGLSASRDHIALAVTSDAREAAFELLRTAAKSEEALLRANAIESLTWGFTPGTGRNEDAQFAVMEEAVRRGLGDENRGVRFVSAMAVGRLKLETLAALAEPLRMDESASVQAAAMYALKRCGRKVDLTPLAGMMESEDPEIRGNAAFVLGEMGDKSAVGLLKAGLGQVMVRTGSTRGKIVDMQIAEALVKLGDYSQLEVIRAAVYSRAQDAELAALACQMCGELKDARWSEYLRSMALRGDEREVSPEVRIAATAALAKIGEAEVPVEVVLELSRSEEPGLRAQSAAAMGVIGQPKVTALRVQQLMSDSHPAVQVAAAGAMVRMSAGS